MSLHAARHTVIAGPVRQFGVTDYDQYWVGRKQMGNTHETRLHRFLVELVRTLAKPDSRVLDLGVGPGHVYRGLCEHFETYGVEISSEAIRLYDFDTRRIAQADLNDGIPDFGLSFDVIVASMIMHHLADPPGFLGQVRERLAPGGRFVAVIPNICYGPYRVRYLFGQFPPISLAHRSFQTPAEFERMVVGAGFTREHRLTPKRRIHARLWPTWFSPDLVYVFAPQCTDSSRYRDVRCAA